jgi:hypothetical protein
MTSPSLAAGRFGAAAAIAVMAAAGAVSGRTPQPFERGPALEAFQQQVDDYVALHRRLERPLPPLTVTRDPRVNAAARQALAEAIRRDRAGARQGDIIAPDAAEAFRDIVADALASRSVEGFLSDLQWEHLDFHHVRAVVNAPLPDGATHEMPVVLLMVLPVLPPELEYRIVNHDLVLWDVHADLVIDYVPAAFGPSITTTLE